MKGHKVGVGVVLLILAFVMLSCSSRLPKGPREIDISKEFNVMCDEETKIFHDPSCPEVAKLDPNDKKQAYFGSFEEAERMGYTPCEKCKQRYQDELKRRRGGS